MKLRQIPLAIFGLIFMETRNQISPRTYIGVANIKAEGRVDHSRRILKTRSSYLIVDVNHPHIKMKYKTLEELIVENKDVLFCLNKGLVLFNDKPVNVMFSNIINKVGNANAEALVSLIRLDTLEFVPSYRLNEIKIMDLTSVW